MWYAVNTKPRAEDLAARNLEAKGIKVFLPKIEVTRRRGFTSFSLNSPLFPGYLFVDMVEEARDLVSMVSWTPGVKRVLCVGDVPIPVPDEAIDFIQWRIGLGCHGAPLTRRDFPHGSPVAIRYGPFAGLVGVVDKSMSRKARVRVLLQFMQRLTAIEFDQVYLDRLP